MGLVFERMTALQHLQVHSHIQGIPFGTLTICLHQLEQWVWVRGVLGEVWWEFTGPPDFDFDIVCVSFPLIGLVEEMSFGCREMRTMEGGLGVVMVFI